MFQISDFLRSEILRGAKISPTPAARFRRQAQVFASGRLRDRAGGCPSSCCSSPNPPAQTAGTPPCKDKRFAARNSPALLCSLFLQDNGIALHNPFINFHHRAPPLNCFRVRHHSDFSHDVSASRASCGALQPRSLRAAVHSPELVRLFETALVAAAVSKQSCLLPSTPPTRSKSRTGAAFL